MIKQLSPSLNFQNLNNLLNVLHLPSINQQPFPNTKKQRLPQTTVARNPVQTIKVGPNSDGGVIQLQTGYGIQTNKNDVPYVPKKEEHDAGKTRKSLIPPLPHPPSRLAQHRPPKILLRTEKPQFYYNPDLDDIAPNHSTPPPTYYPPQTPSTVYQKRPIESTYSRSTGKTNLLSILRLDLRRFIKCFYRILKCKKCVFYC